MATHCVTSIIINKIIFFILIAYQSFLVNLANPVASLVYKLGPEIGKRIEKANDLGYLEVNTLIFLKD